MARNESFILLCYYHASEFYAGGALDPPLMATRYSRMCSSLAPIRFRPLFRHIGSKPGLLCEDTRVARPSMGGRTLSEAAWVDSRAAESWCWWWDELTFADGRAGAGRSRASDALCWLEPALPVA